MSVFVCSTMSECIYNWVNICVFACILNSETTHTHSTTIHLKHFPSKNHSCTLPSIISACQTHHCPRPPPPLSAPALPGCSRVWLSPSVRSPCEEVLVCWWLTSGVPAERSLIKRSFDWTRLGPSRSVACQFDIHTRSWHTDHPGASHPGVKLYMLLSNFTII